VHVSYNNSKSVHVNIQNEWLPFIRNVAVRTLYWINRFKPKTDRYSENENKIIFGDVPSAIFLPVKKELDKNQRNIVTNIHISTTLNRGKIFDNKFAEGMETWRNLNNQEFRNDMIYNGISLAEILTEKFYRFFSDEAFMLINLIDGTETFIKTAHPQAFVTWQDVTPVYRVITRVFKTSGVPTLIVQHGVYVKEVKGSLFMPVEADKQAVWGNSCKEYSIESGKSPETQVITGNPKYDFIITAKNESEKEKLVLYNKLGLNPKKGVVVIATQWYAGTASCYTPEENEYFISKTLEAMKKFPEKQIVVKLHPRHYKLYKEITQAIRSELGVDNVVITKDFLWELLSICDLLITQTSTVGLEAMLFDKPVITFDSIESSVSNPYVGTGSVIEVHKGEDIVPAIKDALYNEDVLRKLAEARKRFVYEYTYLQDGKAAKRIADLLEDMMRQNECNNVKVS
jgi:hypothetical protein